MKSLEVLSVEEMYAVDQSAINADLTHELLMENAGVAVSEEIQRHWPATNTIILCGPGANGGDGWVIARRLAKAGWPVKVASLVDPKQLKGSSSIHANRWGRLVEPATPNALLGSNLIVDALFGAGLNRNLKNSEAALVKAMDEHPAPVISVDLPSGVNGNDGQVMGAAAKAAMTVTFFRKKPGHLLAPGRFLAGKTIVADIGIPEPLAGAAKVFENAPPLWNNTPSELNLLGHKYSRGHVLVVGGKETTGASRLAARAALRGGAGLVTIAAPSEAWPIYAASELEVMVRSISGPTGLADLLQDPRYSTVILGPGLGVNEETQDFVKIAARSKRNLVLDADALTAFAEHPKDLFDILEQTPQVILTPHAGEFRRLFPDAEGSKLNQAKMAAFRAHANLILKGPDTVIAAPDGKAAINTNGPAWLATAGSGDVLAGIVGGLMSEGTLAFDAAAAGVWLHGASAARLGRGMIASDIINVLPQAFTDAASFVK